MKVQFEINNQLLDLEFESKNMVEKSNGEFIFDGGYAHLYSNKLRIQDNPKTGIPNKNFKMSLEFKTKKNAKGKIPLFSIDAVKGKGGHDRHIYLNNGALYVRVWPHGVFKAS